MATRKQSKLGRDMGLSPALAERAYALLLRSGGAASTTKVTRRVLGSARSAPWRPILDALLDADPRFERTGSGWRLATPPRSGHRPPQDLVALALATTGSVPERHRVVRLSAVRLSGDQIAARFDVVVNSRRRLAQHLLEAAGLGEEAAEETPSFAEIAEPLREFLGDAPIVGFGIAAALEFLTVELSRAGKPGLANRQVELDMLARLLLTERRKPSLVAVAEQLGLNHPRPGYPPADAEAIARVTLALVRIARQRGGGELLDVQRALLGVPAPHPEPRDQRWLAGVPAAPGVYLVRGRDGAVLYVGKGIDLRRRLAAYLGRSFALLRRLEGLSARAARVETIPTDSDLEARVLEARLIRRHRPPFNVQRRQRQRRTIIRAAANDPVPRAQLVADVAADGALYLGPFRSERAARASLALAKTVYPPACMRRLVDLQTQRDAVQAAVRLLSGNRADALDLLQQQMRSESGAGDRAAAERTRALIRRVLDFVCSPSPLLGISLSEPFLAVEPPDQGGRRRAHLLGHGHLLASTSLAPDIPLSSPTALARIVDELRRESRPPDHEEDAHIVTQWLGDAGSRLAIVRLSPSSARAPGQPPSPPLEPGQLSR